ncbi:phage holin family protein [Klebsiella oxytoca]|nr:phage holin family protein [Klebsiella oxytoca]
MQNSVPPPDWWGAIMFFLQQNSLAIKGALTAFFTALLFSLWDGEGWRRSVNAGLICFIVSAAVVSAMHQLGMSEQDWSFIIGATVGGIGVDRCRALAVSIVAYIADQRGIKRNDKR